MAVKGTEVDALPGGTDTSAPSKGGFALNTIWRHDAWEVRKGFGQVAQFDTSMSLERTGATTDWGYTKHLGSRAIVTDFGHTQILSAFDANVSTGSLIYRNDNTQYIHGQNARVICLSIFDVTANNRWEEVLKRGTSEDNTTSDIRTSHGVYETSRSADHQDWIPGSSSQFFFEEFGDAVLFGSVDAGLWVYFSSSFPANRKKSVTNVWEREWTDDHSSEGSVVRSASLSDGQYTDSFAYLTKSDLGSVSGLTTVGSRMAYASDRQVYFSDVGFPTNVVADNFIIVPSQTDIVSMKEQLGSLLIFTKSETFHYRPSNGTLASQGSLIRLSDTVGCSGCCAVACDGHALVWSDRNGVYRHDGDLQIHKISQAIDDFFTSSMPSPLSTFSLNTGATTMVNTQPLSTLRYDEDEVTVVVDPVLDATFVSVPSENIVLCYSSKKWSVWTTESIVNVEGGNSRPGTKTNIQRPVLLPVDRRLFMVGGLDDQALNDDALRNGDVGIQVNNDTTSMSYYILEYGRGGAIDRSVGNGAADRTAALEDFRIISGKWVTHEQTAFAAPMFSIDPPINIPRGFAFPDGGVLVPGDVVWLFPISLVPDTYTYGQLDQIDEFRLSFTYDDTQWVPIIKAGGNSEIDFLLPPERISSINGYSPGAPVAGSRVTIGTGASTHIVFVDWDGNAAPGADWANSPYMNVPSSRRHTLIYLPFKRLNATDDLSCLGTLEQANTDITRAIAGVTAADLVQWEEWSLGLGTAATPGSVRSYDTVAQPVDWALVSEHMGLDEPVMVKLRTIYSSIMSHGAGDSADALEANWLHGLYNVAFTADGKMWMAQIVDHDGVQQYQEVAHETLRTRIRDASSEMINVVFNTTGVTYGDKATAATGSYIIGDEQFSVIATSGNVKGQYVQTMQFGFIQNRAQALRIQDTKASLRIVGSRRRRSH